MRTSADTACAAILAIALAGCGPSVHAANPAERGSATRAAPQQQTPEAFVLSLYGPQLGGIDGAPPEYDGNLATVSSARTAALFAEAAALTPEGLIGYPEGFPLWEYEEWGTLAIEDVVSTGRGQDRAEVSLVLVFTQPDIRLARTFDLVREGGRWRLDDIHYDQVEHRARFGTAPERPSLVDGFDLYIAAEKAASHSGD